MAETIHRGVESEREGACDGLRPSQPKHIDERCDHRVRPWGFYQTLYEEGDRFRERSAFIRNAAE